MSGRHPLGQTPLPPGRHPPPGIHPSPCVDTPWQTHPQGAPSPQIRPLQRTVRILLECILVDSVYVLQQRRVNSKFSNFAAAQLEAALGTFYAPVKPLSEVTVLEYRDPISRLARRFFHHLLQFTRFDKAFLLAVDIGARDLFMVWIFLLMSI